jgi:hypothetical protein
MQKVFNFVCLYMCTLDWLMTMIIFEKEMKEENT